MRLCGFAYWIFIIFLEHIRDFIASPRIPNANYVYLLSTQTLGSNVIVDWIMLAILGLADFFLAI